MKLKLLFPIFLGLIINAGCKSGVHLKEKKTNEDNSWSVGSDSVWKNSTASLENIILQGGVTLDKAGEGSWTSTWKEWGDADSAALIVRTGLDMFENQTIESIVKGSEKPFTGADGTEHDWYGRCMMTIVDSNRWIMALRSGIDHINWKGRDAIHLITSSDEGRTWGKLNLWFDGTPILGMPYEDSEEHSEPGLYKMPNGDLVLQFWRKNFSSGTKQMRSTDKGKTWVTDIEQISIAGAPEKIWDIDAYPIGTQNFFADPENPNDIYMAFEYYFTGPGVGSGTMLARSTDNCKSYTFLSWIMSPEQGDNFEPAIEYLGNRTIIAVVRENKYSMYTWQAISTDMGASFGSPVDISAQVNGGVPNGAWQRARLYKESNPDFQINSRGSYANGDGRLWGFGIHQNGNSSFPLGRKPSVYWSDDNGTTWYGPQLLHGPKWPGTDTGYGDMRRRRDGTFVAATYYATSRERSADLVDADVEQYTFNVQSIKFMIETDKDGDGLPDSGSSWRELHNGYNFFTEYGLSNTRWRIGLQLSSSVDGYPKVRSINLNFN